CLDDAGIGIQFPAPGSAEALEVLEVRGRMNPQQFVHRCRPGLEGNQRISDVCITRAVDHCTEPSRSFWVL
ncbi:MAG: hypothetical protein ACKOD2_16445, partial [Ilumatobacteraceae bacterium]